MTVFEFYNLVSKATHGFCSWLSFSYGAKEEGWKSSSVNLELGSRVLMVPL